MLLRKASTVLLALLTLSTVIIAAVSLSEVVRSEILVSRSVDYTTVATYAAESALEYNAFRVRKDAMLTGGALKISDLNNSSGALTNGASWKLQASGASPGLYIPNLQPNAQISFAAYDPDSPLAGGGKQSMKILRDNTKTAGNYPLFATQILDLAFTYFLPGSGVIAPPTTNDVTSAKYGWNSVAGGGPTDQTIVNNSLSSATIYDFTLKNYCTTSVCAAYPPMTAYLCSGTNGTGICDMSGRAYLTATATFNGVRRVLTLNMPRVPQPSGLWSHAVFSECPLIKDPTQAPPACP
jgi:hypothetical protein